MLRRPLRAAALALALAACATSGCGLPDALPDLPPPDALAPDDAFDLFRFAAPASPGTAFRGIEVYYRLFDVNDAGERNLETLDELTARRFIRLARHDDRAGQVNLPLIDRPAPGDEVTLEFDSVQGGARLEARYNRDDARQRVPLRRGVRDDGDRFKPFTCSEFEADDGDVAETARAELAGDCASLVQMQAYALSYGRTDEFTVHGDAVFLGSINLAFGP